MSITESARAGGWLNSPAATIRFEPHCSCSATLRNCAAGSLNVLFNFMESGVLRVTDRRTDWFDGPSGRWDFHARLRLFSRPGAGGV